MGIFDLITGRNSVDEQIKKSKESNASLSNTVNNLLSGFIQHQLTKRKNGGLIFNPTVPLFDKNILGLSDTQSFKKGGVIRATERLRNGGLVYEKGKPVGRKLKMEYVVKDVDSVPAILAPNEYVLTPKMVKRVKKVFKKNNEKLFKGM
jgi:hypothetical protein